MNTYETFTVRVRTEDLQHFHSLAARYHSNPITFAKDVQELIGNPHGVAPTEAVEPVSPFGQKPRDLFKTISKECTCCLCFKQLVRSDRVPWRWDTEQRLFVNCKHGIYQPINCAISNIEDKIEGHIFEAVCYTLSQSKVLSNQLHHERELAKIRLDEKLKEAETAKIQAETDGTRMTTKVQAFDANVKQATLEARNKNIREVDEEALGLQARRHYRRNNHLVVETHRQSEARAITEASDSIKAIKDEYYKILKVRGTLEGDFAKLALALCKYRADDLEIGAKYNCLVKQFAPQFKKPLRKYGPPALIEREAFWESLFSKKYNVGNAWIREQWSINTQKWWDLQAKIMWPDRTASRAPEIEQVNN